MPGAPGANGNMSAAVDDLISSAQQAAVPTAAAPEKKAKEKATGKLVYSDNEVSPEEKMAMHPKYAYAKA